MSKRTIYNLNEIVIHNDYAEIIIYNKHCEEIARTKIDIDDIDKVKDYKWGLNNNGYIRNNKTRMYLHRFITNAPKGKVVDHINHDRLDNRKCNLRICTYQQNNMNLSLRNDNSSGYAGICWYKSRNKWVTKIIVNGKSIHLGYFENKEDAIKARKEAEEKYFGKYRRTD